MAGQGHSQGGAGIAPSPRAFEKRRISDLDVTRARIVHRAWYALRLAIGVILGGASLRTIAELFDLYGHDSTTSYLGHRCDVTIA